MDMFAVPTPIVVPPRVVVMGSALRLHLRRPPPLLVTHRLRLPTTLVQHQEIHVTPSVALRHGWQTLAARRRPVPRSATQTPELRRGLIQTLAFPPIMYALTTTIVMPAIAIQVAATMGPAHYLRLMALHA